LPGLKALLVVQHEQLPFKDEQLLRKDEQLTSRDEETERLKLLIAKLRRMKFGRKSEKLDWAIEQLELKLDELQASHAEQAAACPSPLAASDVNRATKRAQKPLPAICRARHKILPKQDTCPDCSGALKLLGEHVSEILEYGPEHFKVIRQVRQKLACARCDKIIRAAAPSRPIERGDSRPRATGPCVGLQICRSFAAVSPGEIYARDRVELDRSAWRSGWGMQPITGGVGGDVATLRDERDETTYRRHPGARARARERQNENGTLVDLRAG
jgi:hypothetical protein